MTSETTIGSRVVGPGRVSHLDATLGPVMRPLRNELVARVLAAHEPFGLRMGALSALGVISERPGCSQQDLVNWLVLDKSTIVAIIDQLETRGLARRERSLSDRRRNGLFITPEGDALMREMLEQVLRVEAPIRAALGEQEFGRLVGLLNRAYAALLADGAASAQGQ